MTAWNKIDANQLLPESLTTAASAITSAVEGALSSAADALSLPSFPSLPSSPNTTALVINTILNTLEGLLSAGRIHTLVVPISKTIARAPTPALPPTLNDLQVSLDVTLGPDNTIAADAYADLVKRTGGNAGFYNAFAESLMDIADSNRPQYDNQSDAVAMAVLLIGASRFYSIVSAASMIDQLVHPKGGNGAAARMVPIPSNAKARVVGTSVSGGVGVRIDWDVPKPVYASPYFPGVAINISRYAIIRSTDPRAQSARSVLDFFSTQTLTEGMTSGPHKVVSIGSGTSSAYLDTSAVLDPSVPLYYCIAWETRATEPSGTNTMAFDRVSNVVKVVPKAPQPQQTGTAPDWVATGSAIEAFPPAARVLQTLIEKVRVYTTSSNSSTSRLSDAMKLATDATTRVAARATELASDVSALATSLTRAIPSLYVTQMSSASGGNVYLMSELAKRLQDTSDESRPPFDNGEYVCGVCFVAGAPRYADLAKIIAFFEALFGPADPSNPLLGLLTAIDTAVVQAEAAVFGPNMQPLPAGTVVDPLTGKPPTPNTPVTANDGTPVSTTSPENPNAGDTNITPTKDLC